MQNSKRYSSILVICCIVFAGCHWLKKQAIPPDQIVMKFVRALENLDLDLAISYCDSSTAVVFEQFKLVAQSMSEEMRTETVNKMKLIQKATCEINEDIARCTLCCDEGGRNIPDALNLRLVKGEWLIAINPNTEPAVEQTPATLPTEEPTVEAPSAIVNEED